MQYAPPPAGGFGAGPALVPQNAFPQQMASPGGYCQVAGKFVVMAGFPALPHVCMKCGQPSHGFTRTAKFQWYPPWLAITILIGALIFVILASIMTKRTVAPIALCQNCDAKWRRSPWICTGLVLGGITSLIVFPIAFGAFGERGLAIGLTLAFLLFVTGIILAVVVSRSAKVSPQKIDNGYIWLRGVHAAAIEAIASQYGTTTQMP